MAGSASTASVTTATRPRPRPKATFCRVCHASCPMEVDVVDNKVIAVRGVIDDPLFEGYTCIKGRQLPDQMADPDRLRAPLRRRPDGTFEQVDRRRRSTRSPPSSAGSSTPTGLGPSPPTRAPAATRTPSPSPPPVRSTRGWSRSRSTPRSPSTSRPKGLAAFRLGGWEAGYHNFTDSDVHMAIGYNPMVSLLRPDRRASGDEPVRRHAAAQGRGHEADRDRSAPHRAGVVRRHPPAGPPR